MMPSFFVSLVMSILCFRIGSEFSPYFSLNFKKDDDQVKNEKDNR